MKFNQKLSSCEASEEWSKVAFNRKMPIAYNSYSSNLRAWLHGISLPVYILIMLFAISSWIDINGVWVELSLLVNELPEGWNLPSYIFILIQVANISPLVYTILVSIWPRKIRECPFIYVIVGIGLFSCLGLVFFWDYKTMVNGNLHSTGLFIFTFLLALVDCTSSVVYLPYMALFKPQYLTAFYIGEGLSGLFPAIAGLIQGVGGDAICVNKSILITNKTTGFNTTEWMIIPEYQQPKFSITYFFVFLSCMIIISGLSFTCIHFMAFAKDEHWTPFPIVIDEAYQGEMPTGDKMANESTHRDIPLVEISDFKKLNASKGVDSLKSSTTNTGTLTAVHMAVLLVILAWLNGLSNAVLPSTQSYTCLPYGNMAYTLSVRLSIFINPLACFVSLFIPLPSLRVTCVLTGTGTIIAVYHLVLAALSPNPPLQGDVWGDILVISTSVVMTALCSYTKVAIASILRDQGGRRSLILCGAITQIGSFLGAVSIFVAINVYHMFESMPIC